MPPSPGQSRRFLFIRLSSFGDIVLAEPLTRAVKLRYPGSRVVFATRRRYAGLPALFSSVDAVSAYPGRGEDSPVDWTRNGGRYDVVIDLQANRRSKRIVRRLGASRVLRYRRPRLGRFFTVYLPWIWKGSQPHTLKTYFQVLEPLGIAYSGQVPSIKPDEEAVAQARAQAGEGALIGICPGSSSPHKSWGEARFGHLVRLLAADRRILLVGSEADRVAVDEVRNLASGCEVKAYVGNDVARIAAFLSLCSVTVTNDSGLMHLAGAVGSRPLAIFGPTSPLLGFTPVAEGAAVLSLDLDCSPCSYHGTRPCHRERRYCMEGITPEHVASVVSRMLGT